MLLFTARCFTRNISPRSQNSVIIYSPFSCFKPLWLFINTKRELQWIWRFQVSERKTLKVVLITCVLDSWSSSFVWQTNKYLSCYSLIIFSSVSSKLLHPELLSSRIKSVSSKWFCYTGWTDSLKRSISKERFIHKWLLLSWMFMKVSIMASEHVWRYFHVAFLPFLSSGPHAISMVIEKRGQDVAQKFTFCVTELKESRIGLERQVSDDRIQIFGSFMYKMKSMCLFLVESSSITPFPLLIHDLFSILLVWTVKGYRKSVLFACLQVLFWSSLMMFIALKSCWSWRVLVLV